MSANPNQEEKPTPGLNPSIHPRIREISYEFHMDILKRLGIEPGIYVLSKDGENTVEHAWKSGGIIMIILPNPIILKYRVEQIAPGRYAGFTVSYGAIVIYSTENGIYTEIYQYANEALEAIKKYYDEKTLKELLAHKIV